MSSVEAKENEKKIGQRIKDATICYLTNVPISTMKIGSNIRAVRKEGVAKIKESFKLAGVSPHAPLTVIFISIS